MVTIQPIKPKVYLFWDNSNIYIPARFIAQQREGGFAEAQVRIHFRNMFQVATAGRPIGKAVVVGSVPPEFRKIWDRLKRDTGCAVDLFERGQNSGTEQAVDEALQVHMLRTLNDVNPPQIVTLMSGDGAGYVTGSGFHADLERMHAKGWGIEVVSWDTACNNALRDWAKKVGVYIPLEDYYDAVTFLDGTRKAKTPSLIHRPYASPREVTD